jgi:hypothetical protein
MDLLNRLSLRGSILLIAKGYFIHEHVFLLLLLKVRANLMTEMHGIRSV